MLHAPDDFDKPGRNWTPEERAAVKIWLNTPPQLGQILRFTAMHLGAGTTAEDAESTWNEFNVSELNYTIDTYDPEKGKRFQSWLRLRLSQVCWRDGKRIRQRQQREVPIEAENADGDVIEIERADPHAVTEGDIVSGLDIEGVGPSVNGCLSRLRAKHPLWYEVIVRTYFQEMSDRAIADELSVKEGYVRQCRFRGLRSLKRCLRDRGVAWEP